MKKKIIHFTYRSIGGVDVVDQTDRPSTEQDVLDNFRGSQTPLTSIEGKLIDISRYLDHELRYARLGLEVARKHLCKIRAEIRRRRKKIKLARRKNLVLK